MISVFDPSLGTTSKPVFCPGAFGCTASRTVSYCRPSIFTAFWISSSLGEGVARLLGTFLFSNLVLVESKYAGHNTILFCFLIVNPNLLWILSALFVAVAAKLNAVVEFLMR